MALPFEDQLLLILNTAAYEKIRNTLDDTSQTTVSMGPDVNASAFGGAPRGQAELGQHVGLAHQALTDSLKSLCAGLADYRDALIDHRNYINGIDERDEAFMLSLQMNMENRGIDTEGTQP